MRARLPALATVVVLAVLVSTARADPSPAPAQATSVTQGPVHVTLQGPGAPQWMVLELGYEDLLRVTSDRSSCADELEVQLTDANGALLADHVHGGTRSRTFQRSEKTAR